MRHLSAAIFYIPDGYETGGQRLLGRQSAGESFLRSVLRYSRCDRLYCYSNSEAEYQDFQRRVTGWGISPDRYEWLPALDPHSAHRADVLYHPSPGLGSLAWRRRLTGQRGYGLCGVTHTTASQTVMEAITTMMIAPIQPWDAVICTSNAVKHGVERLLDNWGDYLGQRWGHRPQLMIDLPIIPLGVECDQFLHGGAAATQRQKWRQNLGIHSNDIVVLFVGRLISYAKAHPIPMYDAIERAARQTASDQRRIHLIQAGWFESDRDEATFKEAAATLCPNVNAIFLDGRDPDVRRHIWYAADIFISLADNIQETFGLTPIEAMAAGLPVVVSDWNGYKESVRHGMDGFRVPTLTPPPGTGIDLAACYFDDRLNYSTYIAESANSVAIDIPSCAAILTNLIENPELRQKLGENGRQRARSIYDWRVVIGAYDDLWEQQRDRCQAATAHPEVAPPQPDRPPIPILEDPFRAFAHYPSQTLRPHDVISLGANATTDQLGLLRTMWINRIGDQRRLSDTNILGLLNYLRNHGAISINEALTLIQQSKDVQSNLEERVYLTLAYLLKFDILRLNISA